VGDSTVNDVEGATAVGIGATLIWAPEMIYIVFYVDRAARRSAHMVSNNLMYIFITN
jgi:hypothetical protein